MVSTGMIEQYEPNYKHKNAMILNTTKATLTSTKSPGFQGRVACVRNLQATRPYLEGARDGSWLSTVGTN